MARTMIVAGNWKMNLGLSDAEALAAAIARGPLPTNVDVAIFPTFPWIVPALNAVGSSGITVGAQNCYVKESGAYTGEVSPVALSEICTAILAGHSERRHIFGETNHLVGEKVNAIQRAGLTAYLCVGETLDQRQDDAAETTVRQQLEAGLAHIQPEDLDRLVVAYEPVWAIGTGVAASADDAQEMCAMVRGWLADRYGDAGQNMRVLYGGSVSPTNASELFSCPDIDGGLVGGASLDADSFLQLLDAAAATVTI